MADEKDVAKGRGNDQETSPAHHEQRRIEGIAWLGAFVLTVLAGAGMFVFLPWIAQFSK